MSSLRYYITNAFLAFLDKKNISERIILFVLFIDFGVCVNMEAAHVCLMGLAYSKKNCSCTYNVERLFAVVNFFLLVYVIKNWSYLPKNKTIFLKEGREK